MYFHLQTSYLLSGKAFNIMSDILHFDVRNVGYIIIYSAWLWYEVCLREQDACTT